VWLVRRVSPRRRFSGLGKEKSADLSKDVDMQRQPRLRKEQMHAGKHTCSPRSSLICDLNGQIEDSLPNGAQ